jgi:hypothetical protein
MLRNKTPLFAIVFFCFLGFAPHQIPASQEIAKDLNLSSQAFQQQSSSPRHQDLAFLYAFGHHDLALAPQNEITYAAISHTAKAWSTLSFNEFQISPNSLGLEALLSELPSEINSKQLIRARIETSFQTFSAMFNIQNPSANYYSAVFKHPALNWPPGTRIRLSLEAADDAIQVVYGSNQKPGLYIFGKCKIIQGLPDRIPPKSSAIFGPGFFHPMNNEYLTLHFENKRPSIIMLRITDAAGKELQEIFGGEKPAGVISDITWNGRNAEGDPLPPGYYWISVETATDYMQQKVEIQP